MKVISMDVWNTLIWSNPEYARERARYLSSELSLPEDIVKRAYYKVKNESDKAAEQKSECLSSINIYKKFLILLGRQDCDWLKLRHGLESLFMEYPPFFLPDTVRLLHLIQDNNTTLSIASNTNFIRGKVLYASILSKWGINWKFKVFSDEVKQPKPHPRFWKIVIKNAQKHTGATPEEILHIGDNKICDGSCKQASIQFCHVNTPRDVVDVLGTIHTAEALQKQQQICKERPFALYELGDDLNNTPFNLSDYSALKFGSDRAARLLGYKMADKFYKNYHSLLIYNKCVIIPSAFNVVKIASTILAHHFMNRLNDLLTREGHDTVEWTTMHRSMSYISDYCLMSKEKRKELLEGDKLYINRDYIKNKVLLFVDDVTITGTHEDKIEKFLVESRLFNRHVFCYAVRYTGNSPEIESKLNHAGMNTLDDYIRITNEPNHHLVVRAIRFLLEQPAETLNLALDKLSDSFIDKLYFACLSKQYHEIEGYHNNFELIKTRYDNLLHSLCLSFT